ncbi:uncharacterized protein LOC132541377 [Erinaceus europaeus]|uniref:Uncharacterized protein LOC132541377 n=1 Tax=Erinaceus europaeus TaxID=9365 RepID=A0ABM3Y9S0_ERIEU|nr:uncharacterized protein LOC132541377 [Erinaceus europaeus]
MIILILQVLARMLPLIWGSLLCWGLLPHAHGRAQHHLNLLVSQSQLETDISDLFSEHKVLERMARIPLDRAPGEGAALLDDLPFVKENLSSKNSGALQLSLIGDLLSKDSSALHKLLQSAGLDIKDVKGLKVTVKILDDSLLQVTLRCKLYISFAGTLSVELIKNIRIGVRLEQMGNQTKVAIKECHTPPGYLSIEVLKKLGPLPLNLVLKLATGTLDKMLPFLLQKMVCPIATDLLNMLLDGLLRMCHPPPQSTPFPEDFQYYVTTTQLTEDAILMHILLITPCGRTTPRHDPNHGEHRSLPKIVQGSMADLVFGLEAYNDILACLYATKEVHVNPHNSMAAELLQLLSPRRREPGSQGADQCRGSVGLTIRTPEPPAIRPGGDAVIQHGSMVLSGPCNESVSFFWQEKHEEVFVLELLKNFLPHHNELLREELYLPLPSIKGMDFEKAHVMISQSQEAQQEQQLLETFSSHQYWAWYLTHTSWHHKATGSVECDMPSFADIHCMMPTLRAMVLTMAILAAAFQVTSAQLILATPVSAQSLLSSVNLPVEALGSVSLPTIPPAPRNLRLPHLDQKHTPSTKRAAEPRKSPEGTCLPVAQYFVSSVALQNYMNSTMPEKMEEKAKCESMHVVGVIGKVLSAVSDSDFLDILKVVEPSSLLSGEGGLLGVLGGIAGDPLSAVGGAGLLGGIAGDPLSAVGGAGLLGGIAGDPLSAVGGAGLLGGVAMQLEELVYSEELLVNPSVQLEELVYSEELLVNPSVQLEELVYSEELLVNPSVQLEELVYSEELLC